MRAVHFVGFRGEEYISAIKVWGRPDFIHLDHDRRMQRCCDDGDVIVFGPKAREDVVSKYNGNDIDESKL